MLRINGVDETLRDEIMKRIQSRGVSVNVHFMPLPLMTAYKTRGADISNFPNAFKAYSNEISLPVYYNLTDEEVELVIAATIESVEEVIQ
jgi:dTDP-4-amino-4,6-dideoxygalactose transaminase